MILVDNLSEYQTNLRHKTWCHMVSDLGESELHAFAARLGLKREWAQLRPIACQMRHTEWWRTPSVWNHPPSVCEEIDDEAFGWRA